MDYKYYTFFFGGEIRKTFLLKKKSVQFRGMNYNDIIIDYYMGHTMQKGSSDICRQQRPRPAYTSMQSDQGLHCSLTESLDTIDCMNGKQRPG